MNEGLVTCSSNIPFPCFLCPRLAVKSREEPAGEKKSCRRSEQLMTCRLKPCGSPMKPSGRNRTAFPFSCSCLMIEPAGDTRVPCWRKNPKDEPAICRDKMGTSPAEAPSTSISQWSTEDSFSCLSGQSRQCRDTPIKRRNQMKCKQSRLKTSQGHAEGFT